MKTDSQLQQDIRGELLWEPSIHAARVGVEAKDGVVTLSGLVDRQHQRRAVTDSVRSMMGVTGVSDQIGLRPAVSASAVKKDIEAALLRTARADAKEIRVDVHGGEITPSGAVVTWAEREAAMHAAWGSPGVRHVVDRMSVAS